MKTSIRLLVASCISFSVLMNVIYYGCADFVFWPGEAVTNLPIYKMYLKLQRRMSSSVQCVIRMKGTSNDTDDQDFDFYASTTNSSNGAGNQRDEKFRDCSTNGEWEIQNPSLGFKDASVEEIVVITSGFPSFASVQYLLVRCFVDIQQRLKMNTTSSDFGDAKFLGQLAPLLPINWTRAPPILSTVDDRPYSIREFYPGSMCTCNLEPTCDANCCCDEDCEDFMFDSFRCSDAHHGCTDTIASGSHDCDKTITADDNLFSDFNIFLHIEKTNCPLLGVYYKNSPAMVTDLKILKTKLSIASTVNMQKESKSGYYFGAPVRAVFPASSQLGYVTLPMPMLNGKCVQTSAIRFLVPYSSTCVLRVTSEKCPTLSSLIALCHSADNQRTKVLTDPLEENSSFSVSCKCFLDKTSSVFAGSTVMNCAFNQTVPIVRDQHSSVCRNVITKFVGRVFWNGTRVRNCDLEVYFGTVAVNKAKGFVDVASSSSVVFRHTTGEVDVNVTKRDGSPHFGYKFGMFINTGVLKRQFVKENESALEYVTNNSDNALRLPHSDSNGLCGRLEMPLRFGVNVFSSCRKKIDVSTENSCSAIKSLLMQYMRQMIPSTYVSKGSHPNHNNLNDFVKIIRHGFDYKDNATINRNTHEEKSGICFDIPAHVEISIFYSEAGLNTDLPSKVIYGLVIRLNNSTYVRCNTYSTCVAYESNEASILITTSVEFVKLPAELQSQQKMFWQKQESLACSQDSCWLDAIQPWNNSQDANELVFILHLSLIVVCLTVLFSVSV